MLIRNAQIYGSSDPAPRDLRIVGSRIERIGQLTPQPGEEVLDAAGSTLLPGLHDHHIHFLSYAAALGSVRCGPPDVSSEGALATALNQQPGDGWLRGYGYHESVAGDIDRHWLDRQTATRPVRIQHRSGRLWVLNSAALEQLEQRMAATGSQPLELPADGRLYDADDAIGTLLGRELPPVAGASRLLASYGVTGITDMTPANDSETLALFAELHATGTFPQHTFLAGAPTLPYPCCRSGVTTAATKIHLHDSSLPEFDTLCATIRASHRCGRPIAVHCVTEVALVFALAAIEEAGTVRGDRIEHASITPPQLLELIAKLNLTVVTQPNFIAERGDAYVDEISADQHGWLYRARGFQRHAILLAGGTDAPFGSADPWVAIRAAVERRTAAGAVLGPDEALTPEQAVELFLGSAENPATPRQLMAGADADLCLLKQPWNEARTVLSSALVRATFISGKRLPVHTVASPSRGAHHPRELRTGKGSDRHER